MWIVNTVANENGSHSDLNSTAVYIIPDGWAIIPDGFVVPDTFPFVDIVAENVTYYEEMEKEREVTKKVPRTRIGEYGETIEYEKEITTTETYIDKIPYEQLTVVSMTAGVVPENPTIEAPITELDKLEAQVTYTALMTDTLLETETETEVEYSDV